MMYLRLLYSSSKKIGPTYSVLRALSTQQCRGDSWISRGKEKHRLYSNGRGASGDSVPSADRSIGGPSGDRGMNVFDRKAKRWHKNRAAMAPDADTFDYLRDEVASSVLDRVSDVSRVFSAAIDVGCGRGHFAKQLAGEGDSDLIGSLYQCDSAEKALMCPSTSAPSIPTHRIVADEEFLPFADNTFDLAVSGLSLHWVNDLPGALSEICRVLKPDSPLIGAIFAGDTLFELRCSLQLAELERCGGFSPHISPFAELRDMGSLLNRAGYNLTTIDVDEIVVHYPSMFELLHDLRGMGETNCAWTRPLLLRRSVMNAAAAIYHEMYGVEQGAEQGVGPGAGIGAGDKVIPATFQLLYFIGWKPHESQVKPARRGSASVSLKDLNSVH